MLLKDAKIGRAYTVKSIHLPFQLERRLEALGMTRQTAISVLNRKGKGILIIKLRGTRFALGYNITKNITVEEGEVHLVATTYYKATQRKSRKVFRLPLSRHWNVPIKAAFCQTEEPFSRIAGYGFKPLTRTVFLRMMKIQLNNDLIV